MKAGSRGNEMHNGQPGELIANWCQLSKGDLIDIYSARGDRTSGEVDMLGAGGSIVWLIQSGGLGRTLFLHEDGFKIRRRHAEQLNSSRVKGRYTHPGVGDAERDVACGQGSGLFSD